MKKINILIIVLLLIFSLFHTTNAYYDPFTGINEPISTEDAPVLPEIQKWENAVYGTQEFNQESHINETFRNLTISLIQAIGGPVNTEYQTKLGKSGAIHALSNLIEELYSNPPASLKTYLADISHNLKINKSVYAQSTGFSNLQNLLPLWKASRNAAYILLSLALLYIGFAIMFRIQISPKTVITIQNSIPRILITIILITFSYAIAGLLIDLIYLIINLGVLIIYQSGLVKQTLLHEQTRYANLAFNDVLGTIFGGIGKALTRPSIGITTISAIILTILTGAVSLSTSTLILLIILVMILFAVFKLWITLLLCYAQIIIAIIIGPLQLVLSCFSLKKENNFKSWVTGLLSNLLVFPAVSLALMLGYYLTSTVGPIWTPPVLKVSGTSIPVLIGISLLLYINKIPDYIKAMFKSKTPEIPVLNWFSRAVSESAQKEIGNKVINTLPRKVQQTGETIKTAAHAKTFKFPKENI